MFRRDSSEDFNSASAATFPSILRSPTLFCHFCRKTVFINIVTAFKSDFPSQFKGKPVRVVEKKRDRTTDSCARPETIEFRVEQRSARFQCGAESFLFTGNDSAHKVLLLDEIGIRLTHNFDGCVDEGRRNKVGDIEQIRLANGATDNATKHIAATFV